MKRWLEDYRDGTLSSPLRQKLEKHLRVCQRCRERLELIRFAEEVIQWADRSEEIPPASPWFSQKVIQRVRQAQAESATLWIPVYRLAQKTIPLMLLLALLMGGLTYYEWSTLNLEGADNPLASSFSEPSDKWGEQLVAGGNTALFVTDPEEKKDESPTPALPSREGRTK
jgi:hypothetical protein